MAAEGTRERVDGLLRQYFAVDSPVLAGDGVARFKKGSATIVIGVTEEENAVVYLRSEMLRGLEPTSDLLHALNEINTRIRFCRMYCAEGTITAETELLAADLDRGELFNACDLIAAVADQFDNDLQARFGGRMGSDTVLRPEADDAQGESEEEEDEAEAGKRRGRFRRKA